MSGARCARRMLVAIGAFAACGPIQRQEGGGGAVFYQAGPEARVVGITGYLATRHPHGGLELALEGTSLAHARVIVERHDPDLVRATLIASDGTIAAGVYQLRGRAWGAMSGETQVGTFLAGDDGWHPSADPAQAGAAIPVLLAVLADIAVHGKRTFALAEGRTGVALCGPACSSCWSCARDGDLNLADCPSLCGECLSCVDAAPLEP